MMDLKSGVGNIFDFRYQIDSGMIESQSLGKLMRIARKRLGLKQTAVAKKLGRSQSLISKWEKGIVTPTMYEWFLFCRLTGLNPLVVEDEKVFFRMLLGR